MNIHRIFDYNGQEYVADITVRTDLGYITECAIFRAVDHQIVMDYARPLYLKEDVGLDYGALDSCIQECIQQLNSGFISPNSVSINYINRLKSMSQIPEEIQNAARAYINSVKHEAWYSPELDDIILDSFYEGVLWNKYGKNGDD